MCAVNRTFTRTQGLGACSGARMPFLDVQSQRRTDARSRRTFWRCLAPLIGVRDSLLPPPRDRDAPISRHAALLPLGSVPRKVDRRGRIGLLRDRCRCDRPAGPPPAYLSIVSSVDRSRPRCRSSASLDVIVPGWPSPPFLPRYRLRSAPAPIPVGTGALPRSQRRVLPWLRKDDRWPSCRL